MGDANAGSMKPGKAALTPIASDLLRANATGQLHATTTADSNCRRAIRSGTSESLWRCFGTRRTGGHPMAMKKAAKKTTRGRAQDRSKVAGGQKYEVSHEAKKTGRSAPAVKKAVKKVGNVRKKVEKKLVRKK